MSDVTLEMCLRLVIFIYLFIFLRKKIVHNVHINEKEKCNQHARDTTLWNSLPEQLRQPDITFGQFKRSLKTLCLNVKGAD